MLIIYNEISTFFSEFALWLALGVVALILIVLAIFFIFARKKQSVAEETSLPLVEALGGIANVVSCEAKGSRLILVLNDYAYVKEEVLKPLGIESFILMSNKVTLVIGKDATELAEIINRGRITK